MARRWTSFEEEILAENYKVLTIKELMEIFPDKSQDAVNAKTKRLKSQKKIEGGKNVSAVNRAYRQRSRKLCSI